MQQRMNYPPCLYTWVNKFPAFWPASAISEVNTAIPNPSPSTHLHYIITW